MSTQTEQPIGQIGSYELLRPIGKGGMGTVYRARTPDGSLVAVKVLADKLTRRDVQLQRFRQEADVAMRLDHPNIVRGIEIGEDDGRPFFAMELVEGENLGQRLRRLKRLPEEEAVRIVAAVAEGLRVAHAEGLIHRDVKPDNILLGPNGEVKLSDLGLVKDSGAELNLTQPGRGLGTPHFMAPEQFKNAKHADIRCDIYSLGATLYVAVTGALPFQASQALTAFTKKIKNEYAPPKQVNPDLSPRIDEAIRRAMEAEADRRPQTIDEFLTLLGVGSGDGDGRAGSVESDVPIDDETMWYVIDVLADGSQRKIKGSFRAVARQIRKGRLGWAAQGSLERNGPYQPLHRLAPFRAVLEGSATASVPTVPPSDTQTVRNAMESDSKKIVLRPSDESPAHEDTESGRISPSGFREVPSPSAMAAARQSRTTIPAPAAAPAPWYLRYRWWLVGGGLGVGLLLALLVWLITALV